jgi:hypothetical protein
VPGLYAGDFLGIGAKMKYHFSFNTSRVYNGYQTLSGMVEKYNRDEFDFIDYRVIFSDESRGIYGAITFVHLQDEDRKEINDIILRKYDKGQYHTLSRDEFLQFID